MLQLHSLRGLTRALPGAALCLWSFPVTAEAQTEFSTEKIVTVLYKPGNAQENGFERAQVDVVYRFGLCDGVRMQYFVRPSSFSAHRLYWLDGRRYGIPETLALEKPTSVAFHGRTMGVRPQDFRLTASTQGEACIGAHRLGSGTDFWGADATREQKEFALNGITVATASAGYRAPPLISAAVEEYIRTTILAREQQARKDSLERVAQQDQARRDAAQRADAQRLAQEQEAAAQRRREQEATARQIAEVTRRNAERRAQSDAAVDKVVGFAGSILAAKERDRRAREATEEAATERYWNAMDAAAKHPVCTVESSEWIVLSTRPVLRTIDNRECQLSHVGNLGDQFLVRVPTRGTVSLEVSGTGFPPSVYFRPLNSPADLKHLSVYNAQFVGPQTMHVKSQGVVDAGVYMVQVTSAKFPDGGAYALTVNSDAPRALTPIGAVVRYVKVWGQEDGALLPAAQRVHSITIDARLTPRIGLELTFDHPPIPPGGATVAFACNWKAPDGTVVWTRTTNSKLSAGWSSFLQVVLTKPGEIAAWVPGRYRFECSSEGRPFGAGTAEIIGTTGTVSVPVAPLPAVSPKVSAPAGPQFDTVSTPSLKARVTSIRFYERGAGDKTYPYAESFSAATARYIGIMLDFELPAVTREVVSTFTCTRISPTGVPHAPEVLHFRVKQGWTKMNWTRGPRGWSEPGKWKPGTYTVQCFSGGELIAQGAYVIESSSEPE